MGASDSTYDPPLTLVPRRAHITVDARYVCTVAPGRTLPATGSLDGQSPDASCLTLGGARLTETVRYADGKRSLIVYDSGTTLRVTDVQIVRLTGHVTEGRGKGQPAQRTVFAGSSQLPTECLSSGLRGSSGRAQLEVHP
ncbi:hypothetical protein [Streptomyces cinnamoneus]|uniref:hypothetical protein n=1 Tax=Streptomyces cinnamoneus TaxID=53446 RepID=UPI00167C5AD7|nr:hypothetical protein [Streptomyces cinnamoneus]